MPIYTEHHSSRVRRDRAVGVNFRGRWLPLKLIGKKTVPQRVPIGGKFNMVGERGFAIIVCLSLAAWLAFLRLKAIQPKATDRAFLMMVAHGLRDLPSCDRCLGINALLHARPALDIMDEDHVHAALLVSFGAAQWLP
jgi:hypothetical protein